MRQVGQLPRIIAWCTVNKTLKISRFVSSAIQWWQIHNKYISLYWILQNATCHQIVLTAELLHSATKAKLWQVHLIQDRIFSINWQAVTTWNAIRRHNMSTRESYPSNKILNLSERLFYWQNHTATRHNIINKFLF